jgi:dihydroorotate dehydrogenase (fumarate)
LDTSTRYLGLKLGTPLVVGASPFGDDVHIARQVQDSGAGAIVMRSLFEEQIHLDALARAPGSASGPRDGGTDSATLPARPAYHLSPDQYLRQIKDLKAALTIPVIASLNGCRPGGWIEFGQRFQAAGADAIELNLYQVSADPELSADDVEAELIETVRLLKSSVTIPLAVKLQPYFTSLPNFVRRLEQAGADGVVIFNRLYQSDYDLAEREPVHQIRLSDHGELLLRLRWLALLSPRTRCSLAATGGVQNATDTLKAILAGAHAVQLVSVLLKNGPRFLTVIADSLRQWMDKSGFRGIEDFRGKMNLHGSGDAAALERGDYQRLLQIWRI